MTIDKEKLKELARSAHADLPDWKPDFGLTVYQQRFAMSAGPTVVLALLAEIERLERSNFHALYVQASEQAGSWGRAHHEISIERDQLKAENDALRKDAERYRGVRRVANRQGFTDEQFDQQTDTRIASFDAAMAKEASHG